MFSVLQAQLWKDKRNPLLVLLFIGASIGMSLLFGYTGQSQITIDVFSDRPEVEEKWLPLLNADGDIKFVIKDEAAAREKVMGGRSDMAVKLMEHDYRIIAVSDLPTIHVVEQHIHKVYTQEALIAAAALDTKSISEIRQEMARFLENPPFQIEVQSLDGKAFNDHNMGTQLLFGFTFFAAMFLVGFKVNAITKDKVSGVWNRMLLSPTKKTGMYIGYIVYPFCIALFQITVVFLLFKYGLNYDMGQNFGMVLIISAVFAVSMISFAMLITGFVRTPEQFYAIYPSIIPILPLISGVYMMPGTITHPILLFIADLFPLTHAMEAVMGAALYNAGWNEIALPMAMMVLISVICMGIGVNLIERRNV